MKKNPLLLSRSNANKPKIARAKKMLGLSLFLLFALAFMTIASVTDAHTIGQTIQCAGFSLGSLALLPLAAGVRGTMAVNGIDESEADFAARKGEGEPAERFIARCMTSMDRSIKALNDAMPKDYEKTTKQLEEVKSALEAMKTDKELLKNLKEEVAKANLAIESIREKGGKEMFTDLKGQITNWHKENKAAIEAIKGGNKAELKPFTLKLNSPMTPGNTYSAATYLPQVEYLPGVTEIVRVEPTLWDYITKGRSGSATLVWVNKYTPSGAADFIAPGVAKPGVSFMLQSETSVAKKVAVSAKTATELLDDIPGMQTFIQQELQYQLRNQLNAAVMSGTASSTDINGIQTLATTFTLSGLGTPNANNWDAILACVAQLRSGNLQGPVTVFVNPVDYANMMLTKASSQGQLFVPANPGATIVQDNNVTVGYVVVALLDYYKIAIYQDMTIKWGWEEDDFTKNLVTAICEMRIHQYFSSNHTGAFIYDTFANIKTAITTP